MKKILVMSVFVIFISMSFVSAGWFSDIWSKTTGNAIGGDDGIINTPTEAQEWYNGLSVSEKEDYAVFLDNLLAQSGYIDPSGGYNIEAIYAAIYDYANAQVANNPEPEPEPEPEATCTDSDGGKDYYEKGNTANSDGIGIDKCVVTCDTTSSGLCDSDSSLLEYYCEGDVASSKFYDCSSEGKVCVDGACVEANETKTTCTDSDGGKDYYERGQIKIFDSAGNLISSDWDDCNEEEFFCYENGSAGVIGGNWNCPNGCKDGACIKEPEYNYVDGCSYLSDDVINKLSDLEDEDETIIFHEGDKIHYKDYVIFPSQEPSVVAKLSSVKNQTTGYASDYCKFTDVISGNVYSTVWTSEGRGVISVNGMSYVVTMSGNSQNASENYIVTIDYPQTSGNNKLSFEDCGIKDTCDFAFDFIGNPANLSIGGLNLELDYNWSYQDNLYSYNSASWSYGDNSQYYYFYIDVEENEGANIERDLQNMLNYGLCRQEKIETKGSEQIVYLCRSIWDVANSDNLQEDNSQDVDVLWFKGNRLFSVSIHNYNYENCYSYEDCMALDERRHREQQENLLKAFGKLMDNEKEYAGNFYLGYYGREFVKYFLESCGSEVEEEESYVSSWSCKKEPIICPLHGQQTEICTRYNSALEDYEKRETPIRCSPGICSGCYVPRWFGSVGDNTCIPYGFRFEHQVGFGYGERENEDRDTVYLSDLEGDEDEVTLTINSDNTAELWVEEWDNKTYDLQIGETIDIDTNYADEDILDYTMKVNDIYYDADNYEDSYIDITVKMVYLGQIKKTMDAYCDIDGKIKEQKTKKSDGSWASCQNNYECESNLCSSGECIEIADAIRETSRLKSVAVRFLCKMFNPISKDNYNECVYNFLGTESSNSQSSPSGSSSSSSSGGAFN